MPSRAHVAFVAPAAPGREERNGFSSRLYELLVALLRVADVDLFLPRAAAVDARDAVRKLGDLEGLTLHLVLDSGVRPAIVHRTLRMGHHLFGRLPRWSTPRRARELARHLDAGRADVLCLHLPVTAHLAGLAPADVPVVAVLEEGLERGVLAPRERTWLHSLAARSEAGRVRRLYARTGERATVVVAISEYEREWFGDAGIDHREIVVLPHGIDLTYFAPDEDADELAFDVAVFGDFRFARNLDPARDAVCWAAAHYPELRWALVGDIDPADADALRAAGVFVTGRVDDLRRFYAETKVVLVPAVSVTGVKTTLVQAWAMGKAAVSTPESVRGLPAVDGANVVVAGTTSALVEQCAHLSGSSARRAELGAAGRRTVLEHLDGAKIASAFADLVMEAVTNG
jgi:glycosyltransferase involved in cell wall biosynthesis